MCKVKVIGAGLAGSETAYYLAEKGIKVELYDIKPNAFTPAHHDKNFGELVCSNSLKSNDVYGNAAGLLKQELRELGSLIMQAADMNKVPAGNALAVDREKFSKFITEKLQNHPNIQIISKEVEDIDFDEYTVIATGPLTTGKLNDKIKELCGGLHFFDAYAPIITAESIDMTSAFIADRYDKGNGDHINCPLNKEEYQLFISELLSAKRAELHEFENVKVFEGCMPIEIMASRGENTLRFGPLKSAGLTDPKTDRWPYACLQLRKEDELGEMYNMIGFQTNLTFPEQKRVFGLIPALKNAEYVRYGVMHRNTFVNAPKVLNKDFSIKGKEKTYLAGQITGVEGYVESVASGLISAIYIARKIMGKARIDIPECTVCGALIKYITTENKDFQPMNANFAILPALPEIIRDKAVRKNKMAVRSLQAINDFKKEIR